ncbi:MAG: cytochrome c [Nitrospira sp.]|nr:cytochrome c [Nitrospira sp.]
MKWRVIGLGTAVLWIVTMGVVAALFVQGHTRPGTDGRTEIVLAQAERDLILTEMRQLLKTVHGVVTVLGSPDQNLKAAESAARSAGMAIAVDVNPAVMLKLPLAFKQMGMSIHKDMDRLADGIAQGDTSVQILNRLSSMTARCTACHDMYRFSIAR